MKLRVLTLPFDPEAGGFDDAALAALCATSEVLSVTDHFFHYDGEPHVALIVGYRDRSERPAARHEDSPVVDLDPPTRAAGHT